MTDQPKDRANEIASRFGNCTFEGSTWCEKLADEIRAYGDKGAEEAHFLKTCGVIELAIRNPNVASYMVHWESRAERAEAEADKLRQEIDETLQLAGGPSTLKELAHTSFLNHQEAYKLRDALRRIEERAIKGATSEVWDYHFKEIAHIAQEALSKTNA